MRKTKILIFLSEILTAKSLYPIIRRLQSRDDFLIKIVNDGFCRGFIETLGVDFDVIEHNFAVEASPLVQWSDVVVTGKTYVQQSEYHLIYLANRHSKPLLLFIPDMGFDVVRAKLRGIGSEFGDSLPYPTLLVADPRTYAALAAAGVPERVLCSVGNPYFDELYADLMKAPILGEGQQGVGYFSTPFELDYSRGILPAAYKQRQWIEDLREVCSSLGVGLIAKEHPQVDSKLLAGLRTVQGSPLDVFRQVKVVVGSYTSTLLEAYVAGLPTISYQPWFDDIRKDVFDGRVTMVKTKHQLAQAITCALEQRTGSFSRDRVITFYPGESVDRCLKVITKAATSTAPVYATS